MPEDPLNPFSRQPHKSGTIFLKAGLPWRPRYDIYMGLKGGPIWWGWRSVARGGEREGNKAPKGPRGFEYMQRTRCTSYLL